MVLKAVTEEEEEEEYDTLIIKLIKTMNKSPLGKFIVHILTYFFDEFE